MTIPRQPLLDDAVIALRAPTQAWSRASGDMGAAAIDGIYHGDVRHVRSLALACTDSAVEWISASTESASRIVFGGLLRGLDSPLPDPRVRLLRERTVEDGGFAEVLRVVSARDEPLTTTITIELVPDFAALPEVKAGLAEASPLEVTASGGTAHARSGGRGLEVSAPGAEVDVRTTVSGESIRLTWRISIPPRSESTLGWSLRMTDPALVVAGATSPAPWSRADVARRGAALEPRLGRWLDRALDDLDALRLTLPGHADDEFYAAGAPWFFTLFGRDSLWAARLALPLDIGVAASTLRVLARLQGDHVDPDTAQQPGKILHELRAAALEIPSEGVVLPPVYYGSVDATALWVCLLVDAWRAGMPEVEVRALLPHLDRALTWLIEYGDADGDGFLDYIDESGRGLANQGWKDSGDSIQWRDGTLARGPIALCEVQAYAYEAAMGAAELIERLAHRSDRAPDELRRWAAALRDRFAAAYWVQTAEGRYPAIALDRDKRPVDSLTSNIGHLVGTGILDPLDEAAVAARLLDASMSSGYGIRTLSTGAAGYWPLSYHGGSVWLHDTAIAAHGLARAGFADEAREVVAGMLAAADGFGYRVPELHSGDAAAQTRVPVPYPAACRPQAWSAAAAIVALRVLEG
ncbi:glycogen debranching N-terminal domain-containing protein [Microbacterium sp. cf332]|uniref:glycogen debranching N-terminal domain-containing protein n=1 Tax=Microbacterium sp. cf332 TaxID=1761804 RepID=UPI00087ECEA7|nr:glycogen debranching N-terminal domain-containing protein [Microbacterium sp. cf332]SDQ46617.1 Glycogen debranching enzyme (alpha-1,6-glucosidase) [Microbacterium sp. cf332]